MLNSSASPKCLIAAELFAAQDDVLRVQIDVLDDLRVARRTACADQAELRSMMTRGAGSSIVSGCLACFEFFKILFVRLRIGRDIAPEHRQALGADHMIRRGQAALRNACRVGMARKGQRGAALRAGAQQQRKPGGSGNFFFLNAANANQSAFCSMFAAVQCGAFLFR